MERKRKGSRKRRENGQFLYRRPQRAIRWHVTRSWTGAPRPMSVMPDSLSACMPVCLRCLYILGRLAEETLIGFDLYYNYYMLIII